MYVGKEKRVTPREKLKNRRREKRKKGKNRERVKKRKGMGREEKGKRDLAKLYFCLISLDKMKKREACRKDRERERKF